MRFILQNGLMDISLRTVMKKQRATFVMFGRALFFVFLLAALPLTGLKAQTASCKASNVIN